MENLIFLKNSVGGSIEDNTEYGANMLRSMVLRSMVFRRDALARMTLISLNW